VSKSRGRPARVSRRPAPDQNVHFSPDKSRAILRQAVKLFLKQGYGAVSMNTIISRVGGSKTTVYARYRDKANLFAAAIDALLHESVDFDSAMQVGDLEMTEALTQIARVHLKVVTAERYIRLNRVVAAEVERFPELGRTFYEQGLGRSYANLVAFLKRQHKLGVLVVPNPKLAADFFFGALLHRRMLTRIYGVKEGAPGNLDAIAREVVLGFIQAYRKPGSSRRTNR
jgi:AcrR family transcriptional regulator